ncbi:MAG: AAA domain-containing protein [Gammaproteobacteria bacterium]|nr:AAA domain-containing protein [Gammaproteobacteria bacterium]
MVETRPTTFGELKASGYEPTPVKQELRRNLIRKLQVGDVLFPGVIGYDDSVVPQLVNALLSCQDVILLGERGQAKSKIVRSLTSLLDDELPVLAEAEIPESPFAPITGIGKSILAEQGDDATIGWLARDDRYAEKLATPDITIADLIGEIDPVKIAEGRYLADESTLHFGLIPRVNHGIFAINELPDLAERIQVGLLNVLEERDVQIRGHKIRLPLDVFLVVTANPEDYTNRGRLITPLKDRFGAQVRTHYPQTIAEELDIVHQEATSLGLDDVSLDVPDYMASIAVEITHLARASADINQRSGVSVRTSITVYETMLANAYRRALLLSEKTVVPRISDLQFIMPALYGKLEFEVFDESEEDSVVTKLLNGAVKNVWNRYYDVDELEGLIEYFENTEGLEVGSDVTLETYAACIASSDVLRGMLKSESLESASLASDLEFLLEGMYLHDLLSKESIGKRERYASLN